MPTIGRADITVNYDGRDLPRQAREIGSEAGTGQAEEFDKAVSAGQAETQRKSEEAWKESGATAGKNAGETFGKELEKGVTPSLEDTRARVFNTLGPAAFKDLGNDVDGLGAHFRAVTREVSDFDLMVEESQAGLAASIDDMASKATDRINWMTDRMNGVTTEKTSAEMDRLSQHVVDVNRNLSDFGTGAKHVEDSVDGLDSHFAKAGAGIGDYDKMLAAAQQRISANIDKMAAQSHAKTDAMGRDAEDLAAGWKKLDVGSVLGEWKQADADAARIKDLARTTDEAGNALSDFDRGVLEARNRIDANIKSMADDSMARIDEMVAGFNKAHDAVGDLYATAEQPHVIGVAEWLQMMRDGAAEAERLKAGMNDLGGPAGALAAETDHLAGSQAEVNTLWKDGEQANKRLMASYDAAKLEGYIQGLKGEKDASERMRGELGNLLTSHQGLWREVDKGRASYSEFANGLERDMPKIHRLGAELNIGKDALNGVIYGAKDAGKMMADAAREAEALGKAASGAGGASKGLAATLGGWMQKFGQFDPFDNFGQALLLIIALLPQLVVLLDASAAGLLILSGVASAALVGIAGIAIGFSNLLKPVKDLPKDVQPAASAIQDLVGKFEKVGSATKFVPGQIAQIRTALQGTMFAGLSKDIKELTDTALPTLKVAASGIGTALNGVFKGVLSDLNSSGFQSDMTQLFKGMEPVIGDLGRVIRNTFGIIGQLLIDVMPSAHQFTGDIADMTGKFLTFLQSPKGHAEVHDWLEQMKDTLKRVGDAILPVATALTGLATPQNIQNTIDVLDSLSGAAVSLGDGSSNVNEFVVALGQLIEALGGFLGGVADAFDGLLSAGDEFIIDFTLMMKGTVAAVVDLAKGIADAFVGIASGIRDIWTNPDKAIKEMHDGLAKSGEDFKRFGQDIAIAVGNASTNFDKLPQHSQNMLNALGWHLGVGEGNLKTFGGTMEAISLASGVSLDKLTQAKSWGQIQVLTGLANGEIKKLENQFGDLGVKGGDSLANLQKHAGSAADGIVGKLGLPKKGAHDLAAAIEAAAGDSKTALSGLANAKSWGDIEHTFATGGKAAKAKLADAIILAMNDSKTSIDKLPKSIQALINKYSDIPKNKRTTITTDGADGTKSELDQIKAKLDRITDKTIKVHAEFGGGGSFATGGVLAGGMPIAGGSGARAFAGGGVLTSASWLSPYALAGEAGLEAIVPLGRPLNQVDPSVRALAAYAQGMSGPTGMDATQNKGAFFAPGAIQVTTANPNAEQVASAVVDRLVPQL